MHILFYRTWRYAAYRQFIWWVHNKLGRNVRRVIPSCAICRIRAEFEDDNANYTHFQGDDTEVSEILASFVFKEAEKQKSSSGVGQLVVACIDNGLVYLVFLLLIFHRALILVFS